jgi:hypothetical protein
VISPRELASLSRYLTRHRGHSRYEFAAIEAYQAGPLIAADGQPVLVLASSPYHPLVSPGGLSRAVAAGEVRYVFVSARGSGSGNAATFVGGSPRRAPMVAWVRRHGTDVSRSAGLAHAGALYRVAAGRGPRRTIPISSMLRADGHQPDESSRVVVADDDVLLREGLAGALERSGLFWP